MKYLLTFFLLYSSTELNALSQVTNQSGFALSTNCYKRVYREKYIPGTVDNPGYVRNWTEQIQISCKELGSSNSLNTNTIVDKPVENNCNKGSAIGGLFGAGIGAALSRKEGRWIGIPIGAASGAVIGCKITQNEK